MWAKPGHIPTLYTGIDLFSKDSEHTFTSIMNLLISQVLEVLFWDEICHFNTHTDLILKAFIATIGYLLVLYWHFVDNAIQTCMLVF